MMQQEQEQDGVHRSDQPREMVGARDSPDQLAYPLDR